MLVLTAVWYIKTTSPIQIEFETDIFIATGRLHDLEDRIKNVRFRLHQFMT